MAAAVFSAPTASATLYAWGANEDGQLGNGTTTNKDEPVPVTVKNAKGEVEDLKGVVAVATGGWHSLALLENGTVRAWGYNEYGQLGNGTTTNKDEPVAVMAKNSKGEVEELKEVVAIAAGGDSFALLKNGTVVAWGSNIYGQLGIGTESGPEACSFVSCSTRAVAVKNLSKVKGLSAGWRYALARLENGTVMGWGNGYYGQVGNGIIGNMDEPVFALTTNTKGEIEDLNKVTAVSAGGTHSLARLENGTVMAWGENEYGQLGDGTFTGPELCEFKTPCSTFAVGVKNLTNVIEVAAGFFHSLSRTKNSTTEAVMAWGRNEYGQLGNGEKGAGKNKDEPVTVRGLETEITQISAGSEFSLAVHGPGCAPECFNIITASSWGENMLGELGDGEAGTGKEKDEPVGVKNLREVSAVAAGANSSLAIAE